MKIGFVGVGAMAKAIIQGLLKAQIEPASDILVHSAHQANYEPYAQKYGLTPIASNQELVSQSDLIVLAVVPNQLESVMKEIADSLTTKKALISIVSGVSLQRLEELASYDQPILRTLPNINAEYGQGMTAVVANSNLNGSLLSQAKTVFTATGTIIDLPEEQFPVFSAISGSAVAYIDYFIDALSRAGVKYGLNKQIATQIAAQTTLGSANSLIESKDTPANLIDQVCSPGGDTIAGLLAMEQNGLLNAVIKGIDVTIEKSTGNNKTI